MALAILAQATALTSLACELPEDSLCLLPDDALPPSLLELRLRGLPCSQPLLALQQLRSLAIRDCQAQPADLMRLVAALPALADLELGFDASANGAASLSAVADALPGLPPLRSMTAAGVDPEAPELFSIESATLAQLGQLSQVTRLEFSLVAVAGSEAAARRLLGRLPALRVLLLEEVSFAGGHDGESGEEDGGEGGGMPGDEGGDNAAVFNKTL